MLKTQFFEKKGKLSSEKKFWHIFAQIIECDRPQGTICEGPQGILTITVEVTGLILKHLRSCWKHNFLKKRQTLQWKKFLACFSKIIECDRPQGKVYEGRQGFLTNTVEVKGLIL